MCYASNWLQADLQYYQSIDGKQYPAKVTLLRPESYFIKNNAVTKGEKLTVSLPEMGLDNVAMNIVGIKLFKGIAFKESGRVKYKQIDEINWANKTNRPTTATFARYTKEVYTYKFKNNKTGEISTINATPNHPFYIVNEQAYLPISEATAADELLSQTGETIKLLCTDTQKVNCGIKTNTNNKPTLVYNFEVYQQHRYFVGDNKSKQSVLVHNPYELPAKKTAWLEKYTDFDTGRQGLGVEVLLYDNQLFRDTYPSGKICFHACFSPQRWKFTSTIRNGFNDVYGNDITHYIYLKAKAKCPNIEISKPEFIVAQKIENSEALTVIGKYPSNTANGNKDFLARILQTPIGKLIMRTANDLDATIVDAELGPSSADSIIFKVQTQ